MLDDSDAPVLIAQKRIADRLPEVTQRRVYLDSDWEAIEQYPDTAPPTATLSANLAHIIYTSGSTGRPKAVAAVHSRGGQPSGGGAGDFWCLRAGSLLPEDVDRICGCSG